MRNLIGREKSGGDVEALFIIRFLSLPAAWTERRVQPHRSANRILSEFAPMGYCMLVSPEEQAGPNSLHGLGCPVQLGVTQPRRNIIYCTNLQNSRI